MPHQKIKFLKDDSCRVTVFDWSESPPEFCVNQPFKCGDVITVDGYDLSSTKTSFTRLLVKPSLTNHPDGFADIVLKKKNVKFVD